MTLLVKILSSDEGSKYDSPKWCYILDHPGGRQTLCKGEFFGAGESECTYKTKEVAKGGITCDECKNMIKEIKKIKL